MLIDLAIEQGVGLAFVGDPHQALPVGHFGAMGSAVRHANASVELDTARRFRDPEYAREHLQLAYASTVHGVQGDTAHASVAGPDVGAAGLYVGLTRGRVRNVSIVVAGTDAAVHECLAESMQRGTPELTMQDAVGADQAEMGRAARPRDLSTMATGPVVGRRT